MAKEIVFSGDELELLAALDRTGCVLTDDGKFYCDLEKSGLSFGSRLPVRIKGDYRKDETNWILRCRVVPAPRTLLIGILFVLLFAVSLLSFLIAEESLTGSALFGILNLALVVNYVTQYGSCMKRFENAVTR